VRRHFFIKKHKWVGMIDKNLLDNKIYLILFHYIHC